MGASSIQIINPRGRRRGFQLSIIVLDTIRGTRGGGRGDIVFRLEGTGRTAQLSYFWGRLTSVIIIPLNANTLDTYFYQYRSVKAHIL